MIILNVIYKRPSNPDAFLRHYKDVHLPLVSKIPGLIKAEYEMITQTFMGDSSDHHMIARMYYNDKQSFQSAMRTDENIATGKDLKNFAAAGVTLFVSELV